MKTHVHDILVARFGNCETKPTPREGSNVRMSYCDEDWELSDGSGTRSARYSGTFDEERKAAVFHFIIMRQELDALLSW